MFDWSDLRHFLAVYRSGSLAKASKQLRVDQTTVGRRVAHLEQGSAPSCSTAFRRGSG
jgi:DNA-binding transcriptional LysR family regulator